MWEEKNLEGLRELLSRPKKTISCTWGLGVIGPVGKKRMRELERGRQRKERRLWVWVWRKCGVVRCGLGLGEIER